MFYGKVLALTDFGTYFLVKLKAPKGQAHQFNIPRRGMPGNVRVGIAAIVDNERKELRLP